ncbi:two pore domain potassium channel family protein [Christiangramia fulva]|uniref:Two pore domain potassium channel family protein n=1 Tax=Christiangramia fulva TaxID=2126553 RepID=A0A2R3Z1Z5_9FLAO|nr:potassium channel family protein [Christiangramia fulva]AVR44287.1 two pore domain potassium channel family protein [Christiangramia fulva]
MNIVWCILGCLLFFSIIMDIIQTTLSMQGGGWLTGRISHYFWKAALKISGNNGRSRILDHVGYFLLVIILTTWVMVLWLSLFLLLNFSAETVLNSTTKMPADIWEKIYYAGYTISTLGVGDYIAGTNLWRIVTNIYSFTGIIFLTMSVTYFIPMISAVIEQRKLGIKLSSLGDSPQQIILNHWNGKDFSQFTSQVMDIADSLIQYSQHHRAYPIIHYFHNSKEKNTIILQLAKLFETLILMKYALKEDVKPSLRDLKPLEIAFENYTEVIFEVTYLTRKEDQVEFPQTLDLKEQNMMFSEGDFSELTKEDAEIRRVFKMLVHQDGWKWNDIENQ